MSSLEQRNSSLELGGNKDAIIIQRLRKLIQGVFREKSPISSAKINEIQMELNKMNCVVINFDDTVTKPPQNDPSNPNHDARLTDNCSIRSICCEIIERAEKHPEKLRKNADFALEFLNKISGDSDYISATLNEQMAKERLIPFFYKYVLGGLDEKILDDIYESVVMQNINTATIKPNDNFILALKHISERLGIKKIPIFVLSLNTPYLMNKWYQKNLSEIQKELKKYDIEIVIIDTMGNKIAWDIDKDGRRRVAGVIEHVKNENKKNFIPAGTIMMADDRETLARARDGVNVVNIEGDQVENDLLFYACAISEITATLKIIMASDSQMWQGYPQVYYGLLSSFKDLQILEETIKKKQRDKRILISEQEEKDVALLKRRF